MSGVQGTYGRRSERRKRAEDSLQRGNYALREELNQASMFEEIVGSSEPLRKALSQVSKVALSDSTVLILGQTGAGKELIARAIHKRSKRAARAFVGVNCAAIPTSLIASELFGHEKGAFTGAIQRRLALGGLPGFRPGRDRFVWAPRRNDARYSDYKIAAPIG